MAYALSSERQQNHFNVCSVSGAKRAPIINECRLPVPRDHPRGQQHGTTSRPRWPAGEMIPAAGRCVKRAAGATSGRVLAAR